MNNETDIFSKLVTRAKEAKLTERERSVLFSAVDNYVKNNPVSAVPAHPKVTVFSILSPFWQVHSLRSAFVAFLVIIMGAGTSAAAQNSLPGDLLYPIRININEEIKAAFLSGPARLTYEVTRVKSRVDEAKTLVAQNKMSDEIRGEIAVRLNSHVSRVQKDIENLTKKGELKTAFQVSRDLETTLKDSEETGSESTAPRVSAKESAAIKEIIQGPLEASTVAREDTENKILTLQSNDENTKIVAEAKRESTQKIILEIEKKIVFADNQNIEFAPEAASEPVPTLVPAPATVVDAVPTTASVTAFAVATPSGFDGLNKIRELLKKGDEEFALQKYNDAFETFKLAFDLAESLQKDIDTENSTIDAELESLIQNLNDMDNLDLDTASVS